MGVRAMRRWCGRPWCLPAVINGLAHMSLFVLLEGHDRGWRQLGTACPVRRIEHVSVRF